MVEERRTVLLAKERNYEEFGDLSLVVWYEPPLDGWKKRLLGQIMKIHATSS